MTLAQRAPHPASPRSLARYDYLPLADAAAVVGLRLEALRYLVHRRRPGLVTRHEGYLYNVVDMQQLRACLIQYYLPMYPVYRATRAAVRHACELLGRRTCAEAINFYRGRLSVDDRQTVRAAIINQHMRGVPFLTVPAELLVPPGVPVLAESDTPHSREREDELWLARARERPFADVPVPKVLTPAARLEYSVRVRRVFHGAGLNLLLLAWTADPTMAGLIPTPWEVVARDPATGALRDWLGSRPKAGKNGTGVENGTPGENSGAS